MLDTNLIDMCKRESLPLWTMIFLVLVYEEQFEFLEILHQQNFMDFSMHVTLLEQKGLLKKHGPEVKDMTIRKFGEDMLKKYIGKKPKKTTSDVKLWIDKWRDIFPSGVNTEGFRYRGNRLESLKKMTKFVNDYDYTKEEIFKATENYVNRFKLKGYAFMQQAHYFIEKKDRGSTLAAECEELRENKEQPINKDRGYGRTIR